MRRTSRWALLPLGLAAIAAACDVAAPDAPDDGDGGLDGGGLDAATCPSNEPTEGEPCTLPSGTTCAFGGCATRIARCDRGAWIFAGNPPPRPPCPTTPPTEDDPCPACWPGGSCTYVPESCSLPPDAGDGGALPQTAVASCQDRRWRVAFTPCSDSGADVQGDAEAGAD